jgi:hypothetical protein
MMMLSSFYEFCSCCGEIQRAHFILYSSLSKFLESEHLRILLTYIWGSFLGYLTMIFQRLRMQYITPNVRKNVNGELRVM